MEEFKYTVTDKPWDISWHYSYTDEFGPMGVVGEAVQYAPERIPELVGAFRKAWDDLPGVLERQGLSQEEAAWFLTKIGQRKQ